MKKFTCLPIGMVLPIIILLTVAFFSSQKVNAQPKNITCEEWKQIVGTDKCKYSNVRAAIPDLKDHNSIWCSSDSREIENDIYENRPPDYRYDSSEEKCVFDAQTDAYERQAGKSTGRSSQTTSQEIKTPKQETNSAIQTIDDWIRENHLEYDPAKVEQMERERNELYKKTAQLKEEMFRKAQEVWKVEMIKLQAELQLEPRFEFLWEGQWPDVKAAVFDEESGVIIKSDSWQNIYLQELADQITKKVILQQGEMEVKVINEKPTENKVNVEVDDFFDIFVIQTHFRVEYDPDKKLGVVNVYEGEVEVKTKDGKTIRIKPDGDKPGVVVVSQKLSPVKLALTGLVLVVIISGGTLLLKRKFAVKGFSKKKK